MTVHSESAENLDFYEILESLGSGLLIFDQHNKLVLDNTAARRILGANLVLIRSEGWAALAMLIEANPGNTVRINDLRMQSQQQDTPMRFGLLVGGSFTPCWIATIHGENGNTFTQIVLDKSDWSVLTELMGTFRSEARSAINDTSGHAKFIKNLLTKPPKNMPMEKLGERTEGMIDLITTEMHHLQLLLDLLHRLELVRTGQLAETVEQARRKIDVEDFLEDFIEEINDDVLDPTIDAKQFYERIQTDIDSNLYLSVSKAALHDILRDVLRNAFIYSEPDTPVILRAMSSSQGRHVTFEIVDEGCGVRQKETDRVFTPFQRARQPQVIREHGYGLSLYLAKAEVESMGGRMWFRSEEGVGSTFSFKLPSYSE